MRSVGSLRSVRGAVCAVVAAVAAGLLTGCGVPGAGTTGIGVDADGEPVGFVAVCGHHIDGLTLYTEDEDGETTVNTWTPVHPIEPGVTSWPLTGAAPEWGAEQPTTTLVPGVEYVIYGWAKDNSWSATHVHFTLADLKSLSPGRVSFWSDGDKIADAADFKKEACQ